VKFQILPHMQIRVALGNVNGQSEHGTCEVSVS